MPKEVGTVIEVHKNAATAVVRLNRSETCNNCSGPCSTDQAGDITLEVQDPLGVKEGTQVVVEINTSSAKLSFIVFGLPLISLFLGIGLGHLIDSLFLSGCLNCIRFVVGGGFFLLSLLILIHYDRKLARSKPAHIIDVVNRS